MPRSRRSSINSDYSNPSKSYTNPAKEVFNTECEAAYLTVFSSLRENIKSKSQLLSALQQAGRNPSQKSINQIWKSYRESISYRQFCDIMEEMKPNTKDELLRAFKRIDINNDGFLSHSELYRVFTSRGEKMTDAEVSKIIEEADVNKDGKLDYSEFCTLILSTSQQCQQTNFKKMQMRKIEKVTPKHRPTSATSVGSGRRKQYGVQRFTSGSEVKEEERITDESSVVRKSSSRPSSAKTAPIIQGRMENTIKIKQQAPSERKLKASVPAPKFFKSWKHATSKGCFYLDNDDGTVITHQYALNLSSASKIWLTTKPFFLSENQDAPPNPVDTCMMILRKSSAQKGEFELIGVTDQRDDLQYFWEGDLRSGSYVLMPFTSGCRFRRRRKEPEDEIQLVRKDQNDEVQLSRAFRETLSDIFEICDLDGNGLLNRAEFNWFQLLTSDEEVDDEAWQVVRDNFEMKKEELTREGFIQLHLMQAREDSVDTVEELTDTLLCMGYNKALDMDQACPFEVNIYASECQPSLEATSLNMGNESTVTDKMVIESILCNGEKQTLKNLPDVECYVYKSGLRISAALENKSSKSSEIDIDCSRMKNCSGCRSNSFTLRLGPKSRILVDHVMPVDEKQEWLYQCTITPHNSGIGASSHSLQPRPKSGSKKGSLLSLF